MAARRRDNNALKYHPERRKGCLDPNKVGKGDADSRCADMGARRERMAQIFGEKCMTCFGNSKVITPRGYWCTNCKKEFCPL